MRDNFAWLTPKQVGELIGYSARHVQNLIVNGKLSATKEDGKYYIEKSEVFRVFPKAHKKEIEGNTSQQLVEKERLQFENAMLKDTASQKDKEIEFLRNQIEFISNEKTKMLDALSSTTRLLEYKDDKEKEKKELKRSRNWKEMLGFNKL